MSDDVAAIVIQETPQHFHGLRVGTVIFNFYVIHGDGTNMDLSVLVALFIVIGNQLVKEQTQAQFACIRRIDRIIQECQCTLTGDVHGSIESNIGC